MGDSKFSYLLKRLNERLIFQIIKLGKNTCVGHNLVKNG